MPGHIYPLSIDVPSLSVFTAPSRPRHRSVQVLLNEVHRDAGDVSRNTVAAYLLVPWVGAVVVALTALYRPLFRLLTKEDRVLEWGQVAVLLLATVGAARVAIALHRRRRLGLALPWAAFALGCGLIVGEELAWGQRLLGLETPERLSEVNQQGEITAHNIVGVQDLINGVFALAGCYGSVVALALRWRRHLTPGSPVDLLVPPLFLGSLFLIVFGYKTARFLALHEARFIVVKYGEYVEWCLALAFASFAWFTLQRLRQSLA
jgi:hypothetical protein